MNYQRDVLAIRQRRDAELERVRDEAQRLMAEALAARDAEIRRLRAEDLSRGCRSIALQVGCCGSTVQDVLRPEAREEYNRRRRDYWRARSAGRRAA